MKIAICQLDSMWEDRIRTRSRIVELIDRYRPPPQGLLVFPEMTLSGFTMNLKEATWLPEDEHFFGRLANDLSCWIAAGGVKERQNCLFLFDPRGTIVGTYAKQKLFSYAGEHEAYLPGKGAKLFSVAGARIAPAICYDLRFPPLFYGQAPGVDVYLLIANWPASRSGHWETLLMARAIENQAFVVGVNRVGRDPKNEYFGGSRIIDPLGRTILAVGNVEGVFPAELDLEVVRDIRTKFPFIADREVS